MVSDPFESPRELIAWAEEDTQDLHGQLSEILGRQAYTEIRELDPETGRATTSMRFQARVPSRTRKLTTSILNNLRHAFDQSIYGASVAINKPIEANFTFPFATTPHDLDMRLAGGKKGPKIPVELHDAIRSLEPYPTGHNFPGGDDLLPKLAKIAGSNKHQVLLEFAPMVGAVTNIKASGSGFFRLIQEWDTEKNELVLFESDPEADIEYKCDVVLYLAFGEIEGLEHKPLFPALNHFTSHAKRTLAALEAAVG